MIKWEKPILISLNGATEAKGLCESGSSDSDYCNSGPSVAGGKCDGGASAYNCVGGTRPDVS